MLNSERYLNAFNRIERHLRNIARLDRSVPFSKVVDDASRLDRCVRGYEADLREFADLRNAIVHDGRGGSAIAEPHDSVVAEIESIADLLLKPPTVYPEFKAQVATLRPEDPIGKAVKMMAKHRFSQVPIYGQEGFIALLSANTVTMWLGANVDEDIVSLGETSVKEVLDYAEDADNCLFVGKTTSLVEVLQAFHDYQSGGKRLEAVLITETGSPSQSVLGIITVWDLPRIHKLTELPGR